MKTWAALAAAVLVAAAITTVVWLRLHRVPPAPEAGIPVSLAQERAARVSDLKYEVHFRVPPRRDQPIAGHVTATFLLADASRPLALDFAPPADHLIGVIANSRKIDTTVRNGHIVLPSRTLTSGANTIQLEFTAGNDSLNRNDDFLYTLFVPARASLAFPCFDQPDLKARWKLLLDVPSDWTAVANGEELGRITAADHVGVSFAETAPLPTYLFAFAAGKFSLETAQVRGRTFRMFHRETDAAKVARNKAAVFDLHAKALAWLEHYTGIPYPFGKFDFVLIPSFQFGGMEHAGAIYYNANSLLLDESATQNQLLGRASLISHETSHMWFGDLVTMRWFNDVWMKEVFANFMAAKIVNPSFPSVNHELRFLFQHYPSAYDVDRTEGANPIRQELANLNEAGSLYGAIIYQKAPIVMRQLELLVGPETFRDGLREYLKRYALKNATWLDLIEILDARTPDDLKAWSHAWVEEPGRPTITTDLAITGNRIERLALRQADPRGRNLIWPERVRVLFSSGVSLRTADVTLSGAETIVPDFDGLPAPDWILPVGAGLGYGYFDVDAATLKYLTTSLPNITDDLTRGAALVVLWEAMLEGKVAPERVLDQLLAALPREADELNVQQMLDYLRPAFWRFTPADDRKALAPKLETVLRDGLGRARTTSLKAAWFATLRSTATSAETIDWLERVWRHDVKLAGLPLSETDEADLACDLALRDVPDAQAVLETELQRLKNPDRKARFAFIMPALASNAATRDQFFESLKDVRNRQHEAWVLDGMRYLHHPLRAAASKKQVRPALKLVREIQRTGDIFFPKRWADATLSGYQSVQTAAEVRAFIDRLPPDYPPRLRWVLLSAADPLFRVAKRGTEVFSTDSVR